MENKYQKGQIYKIVDVGYNKCYIGSTIESLSNRMSKHRADYKRHKAGLRKNIKSFDLFDEFGVENCKIEWIENYPCSSRKELEAREGFHQKNTDCVNKSQAGRSSKEWYSDNKEYVSMKNKEYRSKNHEECLQRNKDYRKNNPEKVQEGKQKWKDNNMEHYKEYFRNYYTENKEHKKELGKAYRERNNDIILPKRKEYREKNNIQKQCECGATVSKLNILRHKNTKKHLSYLMSLES